MRVEKFLPSVPLRPFVREFLFLESDQEIRNKIVPDTVVVLAFRYRGQVLQTTGQEEEYLPGSVVSGLRKSVRHIHYTKDTANLLVVFREGGLAAFTRMPAHELYGQSIATDNLFPAPALREVSGRLSEAPGNKVRLAIVEAFLLGMLTHHQPDLLIGSAVQQIRQQNGLLRIKELASSLYISQDSFEKRFRARIGATPKQYASIVRLNELIRKYPSFHSLTEASYEAGYFDQSHFIKDFRQFTGQSPKDFFLSPPAW